MTQLTPVQELEHAVGTNGGLEESIRFTIQAIVYAIASTQADHIAIATLAAQVDNGTDDLVRAVLYNATVPVAPEGATGQPAVETPNGDGLVVTAGEKMQA